MRSLTPQKFILLLVLALLGLGAVGCFTVFSCFKGTGTGGGAGADLIIWGVFDDNNAVEAFLPRQRAAVFGGGEIRYEEKSFDTFEREVLNAVAAGEGPDIIYLHNTWLPKFKDKLAPMPAGLRDATKEQFQQHYVDVAGRDFASVEDGQWRLWAIPLYADTLALYWNRDLFNAKGIVKPPETWEEFQRTVEQLTELDVAGRLRIFGATMGTAQNITRAPDILSMLMLQAGTKMVADDKREALFARSVTDSTTGRTFSPGESALVFYTDFADPTKSVYTWDRSPLVPYSIDAFVEGRVAMTFNYSHFLPLLRSRAPQLNFSVAPVPQPKALKEKGVAVTYANYFGLAVLKSSKNVNAAWSLLIDLAKLDPARAYLGNTNRPPAHRALIPEYEQDPDFAIFARQALTAASWYQPDSFAVEQIFTDMIESVKDGVLPRHALGRAQENVTVHLRSLQRNP